MLEVVVVLPMDQVVLVVEVPLMKPALMDMVAEVVETPATAPMELMVEMELSSLNTTNNP
jgi:hypothetical protein